MTALSVFARPDAAYVVADRASFYLSSGAIARIESKISKCNRLLVAIGNEGFIPPSGHVRIRHLLDRCHSQEELLPGLTTLAKQFAAEGVPAGDPYPADGNLLVALYSLERCRGEAWQIPITTESRCASVGFYVRPHVHSVPWHDFGKGNRRRTIAQARELVDAQRRVAGELGFHFVGGGGELAIVSAGGVDDLLVRRWRGDRVGKPVRPSWLDRFF
jgi:hypothetical protein